MTTEQQDYRRAVSTNLPDDHETRKMSAIRVQIPRGEKLIYTAMVVVVVLMIAVNVAIANGWLK